MRNFIIISVFAMLLFSCKKKEDAAKVTSEPACAFTNLPTWKTDTLTTGNYSDTIFTCKHGDTSMIKYHGQSLYVFAKVSILFNYSDSTPLYYSCFISPSYFDTSLSYATCNVIPYRYYNDGWRNQVSEIMINKIEPYFNYGIFYHH